MSNNYPVSEKTASHFASQNMRAASSQEHEAFLRGRNIPGRLALTCEGGLVWAYYPL